MPEVLRVALPVPLPQLFDYLPPRRGQAEPGCRVRVPFGPGHRVGIVVARAPHPESASRQLKRVETLLDVEPLLDAELMDTLAWAGEYWLGAPGEVYAGALPVALRGTRTRPDPGIEAWMLTPAGQTELDDGHRRGRSLALLKRLADGMRTAADLTLALPGWRDAARRLAKAGLVERTSVNPTTLPRTAIAGPPLNSDQERAVNAVIDAGDGFQPFVLEGVTGSGKTEVYLSLMKRALARDRQVLMLVPEISLTPQSVRRLRERLGTEVEVLHSGLADGERARAWLRARDGDARVVLGTRSAIFTPLPRAGLIVIDEAHDTSYKQHEGFRYHARDLAVVRARALDVPVILGTATPSLETLANVETGRYTRLHLPARAGAHKAPTINIVDIRSQRLRHGLSPELIAAIATTAARDEQALVFRNRRGYAPILMCHGCGWHAQCPRCDKPMTLHAGRQRLACHHCERERRVPETCPDCGHGPLHAQGFGTERLEEALRAHFPEVPIVRVDRETTRRRDAFGKMLETLDEGHAAILVGTQMLAKGHDLAHLTLVAITGVDEGLHSVDFRATERLAQLVVQVAGRAGRARKAGRVLLQTHHPDHALLQELLRSGYASVARGLLDERRLLQLPPYVSQALLRVDGAQLETVDAFLADAHAALPSDDALRVLGPMPAPMPLRAGHHRGQLLLEADRRATLQHMLRPWQARLLKLPDSRKVRWSIDVDPVDLY
ncbi:MAG TPA: primosomal protein N' [Oleiagrimonas sp.]|nr:primosomal protein N' [Oleiagrimonas sp.]